MGKMNLISNNQAEIDSLKHNLYRIGSYAALIILIMIPIQIAFFIIWPHPTTISGWFELFQRNAFLGLIGFDILYMFTNVLMLFLLIAMFSALYEKNKTRSVIGLMLGLVGIITYFSSCKSIEMLSVSSQYFKASTIDEKNILLAAGSAFYSTYKGTAYSLYYVMNGVALILLFSAMIKNESFRKRTSRTGLISGCLMLVPATFGSLGMAMALLSLVPWFLFCIFVIKDLRNLSTSKTSRYN